jgi:hypothetical protein
MAAEFKRTACQATQRIAQSTVIAMITSPGELTHYNNPLNPAAAAPRVNFLAALPRNMWEVLSFNPSNREVCIALYSVDRFGRRTTYRVMDIILPFLGGGI